MDFLHSYHLSVKTMLSAFLLSLSAALFSLGGDSIGPDASLTNDTGGFSVHTGRAYKLVRIEADSLPVREVKLVMSGDFPLDSLSLPVWPLANFLQSSPPDFTLPVVNRSSVHFGNSGVAGANRPTKLISLQVDYDLAEGDYVVGVSASTQAYLSGSSATESFPSVYERYEVHPPMYLPPGVSWAMNVLADPSASDFNGDGFVNYQDYRQWESQFGTSYQGVDLLSWQRDLGYDPVPEPYFQLALFLIATLLLFRTRN